MNILISSFLFGSVGVGYFIYGRKQRRPIPLIAGMGLCAFPYFISNAFVMVAVGMVLISPYVLSRS